MTGSTEGGCRCGAVRYRAEGPPKFVSNCHCSGCRRSTGAAFSTWVGWPDAAFAWTGPAPAFHQSSPGVQRGFCSVCGTPVSYQGAQWPGETHVLIGTLDQPETFEPSGEAFADDALPWVSTQR